MIGHVDLERVSIPMTSRVAHPQTDPGPRVGTRDDGNDSVGVRALEQDQHVVGGLQDFDLSRYVQRARDARREAGYVRLDIPPAVLFLQSRRPRLIGHLPVRRFYDQTLTAVVIVGHRMFFDVLGPRGRAAPESLQVWLAIESSRRREGRGPGQRTRMKER